MILDSVTLQVAALLVILVSALMYVLDTLMLKDGSPGRYWSAAYLSGCLSALCYLIGLVLPGAYISVAIGNGVFVGATGFIWLGCLSFNERPMRVPLIVWAAAVLAVAVAALAAGPDGGTWAGAVPFFLGNALFGALGAIETRRGAVRGRWSAGGLTVIMAIESLWFATRAVVFIASGPESDLFLAVFDTRVASLLTIVLVVAAVIVTSTLRSSESAFRGHVAARNLTVDGDGILFRDSFRGALGILLTRARAAEEDPCVVCLRIDDLRRVSMAFGPEEADAILRAFRGAARRHAPTMALVGDTDTTGITVAFITTSVTDVSRVARSLRDRVVADVAALQTTVAPVVGVGVALAGQVGFDAERLIEAADAAAAEAVLTGRQPFGLA
jgi:GGDEF domain-containing protein